ncbi:hypothetical protein [Zavarzinella formosa]|uniref:hypothetical protein n=1 Tax=Zavarzinella formosa TaxID=360055 RepID=UPI0003754C8F|nr:hypothetical protein [Zavarzinella formosa]
MDQRLHELHLHAGLVSGREKTCGKKMAYQSEELAVRAATAHNRWDKRRHDVEPYPCAFCQNWHVGNIMPLALLEAIAAAYEQTGNA